MDPTHFREVLGQYPTGVVVVTTVDEGGVALGMTVGSFTSVSLDPPLVAFLPDKASSSWKSLRTAGTRFCVNMLSASQEDVCRKIATRKTDKFVDIRWHPSQAGNPIIEGAVGYIDCDVEVIHDAGDHVIVIGKVQDLAVLNSQYPLLFFRGGYGSFRPLSLAAADADLLEQLRRVDKTRARMEELAATLDVEVTALLLVNDELVSAATAGRTDAFPRPSQVGQRLPFMAPMGAVFAAWGDASVRHRWIFNLDSAASESTIARLDRMLDRVKAHGYTAIGRHEPITYLGQLVSRLEDADHDALVHEVREATQEVATAERLPDLMYDIAADTPGRARTGGADYELHSVSVPVFNDRAEVEFAMTVHFSREWIDRATMQDRIDHTVAAAHAATIAIGGSPVAQ